VVEEVDFMRRMGVAGRERLEEGRVEECGGGGAVGWVRREFRRLAVPMRRWRWCFAAVREGLLVGRLRFGSEFVFDPGKLRSQPVQGDPIELNASKSWPGQESRRIKSLSDASSAAAGGGSGYSGAGVGTPCPSPALGDRRKRVGGIAGSTKALWVDIASIAAAKAEKSSCG
jgi:hypothetical protein